MRTSLITLAAVLLFAFQAAAAPLPDVPAKDTVTMVDLGPSPAFPAR